MTDQMLKYGEQVEIPKVKKNYIYLKCKFCEKNYQSGKEVERPFS